MILKRYKKYLCCILIVLTITIASCKKESIFLKPPKVQVSLEGHRLSTDTIRLFHDTVYLLTQDIVRNAGQVLSIEAGTLIRIKNLVSITINKNGRIIARGTQTAPIVLTSDAIKSSAGSSPTINNVWRGITINGSPTVSSGIVSYTRIEFAGLAPFAGALSLINVDRSTILNNIQVSFSSIRTPSFTFAGGDCEAYNLLSYAAESHDYNLTDEFNGRLQNLIAYRFPAFPFSIASGQPLAGVLIQGANTFPIISNLSVIGVNLQGGNTIYSDSLNSSDKITALYVINGAKFRLRNIALSGFLKGGIYINSRESGISLQNEESEFRYSFVHANDSSRAFYIPSNLITSSPPITANDFKNFMLQSKYTNRLLKNASEFQFTDPYNYYIKPNPVPQTGSPLLSGADFSGPFYSDTSFFKPVPYRGAIGADNWLQDWTNFIPLQTNYNN